MVIVPLPIGADQSLFTAEHFFEYAQQLELVSVKSNLTKIGLKKINNPSLSTVEYIFSISQFRNIKCTYSMVICLEH